MKKRRGYGSVIALAGKFGPAPKSSSRVVFEVVVKDEFVDGLRFK